MSSKESFWLGKTSNIRIFSSGSFVKHLFLKKIAIFEIFGKFNKVPLKHVHPCQIHLMRPANERYNSKQLYKRIFEDKQVTADSHFRFQCQVLTNKITKFVDVFFKFSKFIKI